MSDEGKDDVEKIQPDAEGKIKPDKEGKYPEVVPYHKYIGIKEKFTRVEGELKGQVTSLEERLKTAISADEFDKVKKELEEAKGKLQTTEDELKTTKESTLAEKRATIIKSGIPEEKVKDMSIQELNAALVVLEHHKPGADMGGGGGGAAVPQGSPMELARQGYSKN